jgi:nitrogen fixation protein NifB
MIADSSPRGHPCFDKQAHFLVGRLHLPIAPKCNIQCKYCTRALNRDEERPGVSAGVLSPREALEVVREITLKDRTIKVIGIAGPGDPLANEETFEALSLVHGEFPQLTECLSTNGLLLPQRIDDLARAGVTHLTVTINAVDKEVGKDFYSWVKLNGEVHREDAFDILSERQLLGIRKAAKKGIRVKVNSVLVPQLNLDHLPQVAKMIKKQGASIMNIIPLIPLGGMSYLKAPTCSELRETRERCEAIIEVFRLCKQCRADAVGIPGREGGNKSLFGRLDLTPVYHY